MAAHSESSIDERRATLIKNAAAEAAKAMQIFSLDESPEKILEILDEWVYASQKKGLTPDVIDDICTGLGVLWGEQIIRAFNWHWATITFHQHNNSKAMGVIAPDASLAIYPIHFILGCLKNSGVDVTIMLAFNMLKGGKIIGPKPNEYRNLMEGVRRIVPRA